MTPREKPKRDILKHARLSLTPMIDVVFLLLIFFMVGMKFRELDRRVEAQLPKQNGREHTESIPREIWIVIKNQGTATRPEPQVAIDGVVLRGWEAVRARLTRFAATPGGRTDPVIVAPDDEALHAWVMRVLDYLHQLRFQDVRFKQ